MEGEENKARENALRTIRDDVWNLKESPLYEYRIKNKYYPVIGEGNHFAKVMFVGEAPGKNEAKVGKPFCGAAGKILDEAILSIGLKREDVYIANILKDRPPQNRDPLPDEVDIYAPFLDRQIEIIKPSFLVTLGRYSMHYVMEKYGLGKEIEAISRMHGRTFPARVSYGTIYIICQYHPAAAIYQGSIKEILFEDFKIIKKLLDENV